MNIILETSLTVVAVALAAVAASAAVVIVWACYDHMYKWWDK